MGYWWNFVTKQFDYLETAPNADEMKQYIPQDGTAQNLYELLLKMGTDYVEAAVQVLSAGLDKKYIEESE